MLARIELARPVDREPADGNIRAVHAAHLNGNAHQLQRGNIRFDILLRHGQQLNDVAHRRRFEAAEQACIELPLHHETVKVRAGQALPVAQEKFAVAAQQRAPALQKLALQSARLFVVIPHILRHIDLHAAKSVHHFRQCIHIDGDIIVDGQPEIRFDVRFHRTQAVAVPNVHIFGQDAVDLACGAARLPHKHIPGDLQHGHGMGVSVQADI